MVALLGPTHKNGALTLPIIATFAIPVSNCEQSSIVIVHRIFIQIC